MARNGSEAEGWKRRAEQERQEGVSATDAAARWLNNPTSLLGHDAAWRAKPVSSAQARVLRNLGLNPLAYSNAGVASDAITTASRKRRK